MTIEEARQAVNDLEKTEIPNLKRQIFNAETLIRDSDVESVVRQARRDLETYKDLLRGYEEQVRQFKRMY